MWYKTLFFGVVLIVDEIQSETCMKDCVKSGQTPNGT